MALIPESPELRQRLVQVLKEAARELAPEAISYAELARRAGVPWQTVRRVLGERRGFPALLAGNMDARDTRSRVLAAAGSVFARQGLDRASLDAVAAEAGLTKGAVYGHFASKQALFLALFDQACAQHDQEMPEMLRTCLADPDPLKALQHLIGVVLQRFAEDPGLGFLLLEFLGQSRDPMVREELGRRYREGYQKAANLIREARLQAPGRDRDTDPDLMAIFWVALVDGLMLARIANPSLPWATLVPKLIDILWHGIAPTADPGDRPLSP